MDNTAATVETVETVEVKILVDNTGSMGQATSAIKTSCGEFEAVCDSLEIEPRIGVFGDFDSGTPDKERGGYSFLKKNATSAEKMIWMSRHMEPCGGGGQPEALKTALNLILEEEEKKDNKSAADVKIIFIFTDAPPHPDDPFRLDSEGKKELEFLKKNNMIIKFDDITNKIKEQNIKIVTFLTRHNNHLIKTYEKLGDVIPIKSNKSSVISEIMLSCFFRLIGQECPNKEIEFINPICKINLSSKLASAEPSKVIATFDSLLDKNNPTNCLCLTTNPVLGKFWRLICGKYKFIENEKYSSKCQELMDKLGFCKDRLSPDLKERMKKWLDESHNDTEVIRKMILEALEKTTGQEIHNYLIIPPELKNKISLEKVLDLGRSGDFSESSKLIASIVISNENCQVPEDFDQSPDFIPVNGLTEINVFRLIGNLLFPGVLFSKNVALLCAMLSLNNKYLAPLAHILLESEKGKWINWSLDGDSQKMPIFWTLNVIRLFSNCSDYLTEDENEFVQHYLGVSNVSRNTNALLEITIPNPILKPKNEKTFKRMCGCGHKRCFTHFLEGNECVFCYYNRTDGDEIPSEEGNKTNWAQCGCGVLYGILKINDLGVKPKCHYCRNLKPVPQITCSCCFHRFVSHDEPRTILKQVIEDNKDDQVKVDRLSEAIEKNEFICPFCLDNERSMISNVEIKISEFVEDNQDLKACFPYDYETLTDRLTKLWKRVLSLRENPTKTIDEIKNIYDNISRLQYQNMTIHNKDLLFDQFINLLINHDGKFSCMLCANDVRIDQVVKACGNCPNRICKSCSDNWYGQIKPGQIASFANTVCPFCKATPKHALIRNLPLGQVRNVRPNKSKTRDLCEWDSYDIYGFCMSCVKIKKALNKECVALEIPKISDFVCTQCTEKNNSSKMYAVDIETRQCPKCSVSVQKIGGCNHITCQCHSHWCWTCGTDNEEGVPFDEHTVYDHLSKCGGIFSRDHDFDEEYDYDYDYESDEN